MWGLSSFGQARILDSRNGFPNGLPACFRHDFVEALDGIRVVLCKGVRLYFANLDRGWMSTQSWKRQGAYRFRNRQRGRAGF